MVGDSTTKHQLIEQAVASGRLIDISATAKEMGAPCLAFITDEFWHGPVIAQSDEIVRNLLRCMINVYNNYDFQRFGPVSPWTYPVSGPYTRIGFGYTCVLEHHENYGTVLFLTSYNCEHELNIVRTTGEYSEFVM